MNRLIKWKKKTKICPQCKHRKPATNDFFAVDKDGGICWCRKCISSRVKKSNADNPKSSEMAKLRRKRYQLKNRYKMTVEEWELLKARQNNVCAICKKETNFFQVDHCHVTGKIRGLLCFPCNAGLGNMKDDPTVLRSAAEYLERVANDSGI